MTPLLLIILGIWLIVRKKKQEDISQASQQAESFTRGSSTYDSTSGPSKTYRTQEQFQYKQEQHVPPDATFTVHSSEHGKYSDGRIRYSKGLGDLNIDCHNINLQNIEVSSGLGDVEIKLHGGILADGLNRLIISGFIGDIKILVPKDMAVFVHCSNFIGDIKALGRETSGFGNNFDAQTINYNDAAKKLYIAVNSFIGDIKVFIV